MAGVQRMSRDLTTTEPQHQQPIRGGLALWMAVSIAVFVLAGSLALAWAMERRFINEEQHAFELQAQSNSNFLMRSGLPLSERMASQLGEIIGAEVFFLKPGSERSTEKPTKAPPPETLEQPPDGKVRVLDSGTWTVGLTGHEGVRIVLLKQPSQSGSIWLRRDTWLALGGFWALSLALGAGLAWNISRPLRALTEVLPRIGSADALPELPTSRRDEIGRLARTLDRTHHHLIEERDRRRAAERHAWLGRMTASMAHEIRNPVSSIRLHAQLLEQAQPDEAAVSRHCIESEAARIEDLVSQWLSYAKPAPPMFNPLNLVDALQQAIETTRPQARHAGVSTTLSIPAPADSCIIQADRHRIQQVFGNLLRNAIQATPPGGNVAIQLQAGDGSIEVSIEDEGCGFSPTALARLGEPFYSEREGGMGLGIAVAQEICEAHGGRIDAVNQENGGAKVCVILPLPPSRNIPTESVS
jgi:signal transduction histidine kinase